MINNKVPRKLPRTTDLTAFVDPRNSKCYPVGGNLDQIKCAISGLVGDFKNGTTATDDMGKYTKAGYIDFGSHPYDQTNLGRTYKSQSDFTGNYSLTFPEDQGDFGGDAFCNPDKNFEGTFMIWIWVPNNAGDPEIDYLEPSSGTHDGFPRTWIVGREVHRPLDKNVLHPYLFIGPQKSDIALDLIEGQQKTLYNYTFESTTNQLYYDDGTDDSAITAYYNLGVNKMPNQDSGFPHCIKGQWQCITLKAESVTGGYNSNQTFSTPGSSEDLTQALRGLTYSCYHNGVHDSTEPVNNRTHWFVSTSNQTQQDLTNSDTKIRFNRFGNGPLNFNTGTYADHLAFADDIHLPRAFRGRIGAIAIWNTALSDNDIKKAYNAYKDYYVEIPEYRHDQSTFVGLTTSTVANDTVYTVEEKNPRVSPIALYSSTGSVNTTQPLNRKIDILLKAGDDSDKFYVTYANGVYDLKIKEDYDPQTKIIYNTGLRGTIDFIPELNTNDYLQASNYQSNSSVENGVPGARKDVANYERASFEIPLTFYSLRFIDEYGQPAGPLTITNLTQADIIQKTLANNDPIYTARTDIQEIPGQRVTYSLGNQGASSSYFEITQDGNVYWKYGNFAGSTTWTLDIYARLAADPTGPLTNYRVLVDPIPVSEMIVPALGNPYDASHDYNDLITKDFTGCTATNIPGKSFNYLTDEFYNINGTHTNTYTLTNTNHGVHNQYFEMDPNTGALTIDHAPEPNLLSAYDISVTLAQYESERLTTNSSADTGFQYEISGLGAENSNYPESLQDIWNDIVGTTGVQYSNGSKFTLASPITSYNLNYFAGNVPRLLKLDENGYRIPTAMPTTEDIRLKVQCVRKVTILQDLSTSYAVQAGNSLTLYFQVDITNFPGTKYNYRWALKFPGQTEWFDIFDRSATKGSPDSVPVTYPIDFNGIKWRVEVLGDNIHNGPIYSSEATILVYP